MYLISTTCVSDACKAGESCILLKGEVHICSFTYGLYATHETKGLSLYITRLLCIMAATI